MENDSQPPPSNPPEAPDMEKMDQIRRRRMEKLSGPAKPKTEEVSEAATIGSPSITPPVQTTNTDSTANPKITVKPGPSPGTTSDNPFSKLTARPANGTSSPSVSSTSETTSMKRQFAEDEQSIAKAPIKKTSMASAEEDIESWENRVIGQIFRLTLDPNQRVDGQHRNLILLRGLRQDLEEEKLPIRFSTERLDSAILEACSSVPHTKPILDYLLPCWKRILKAMRGLRGYASEKDAILKEAKRLCMSHCIFAVEMPELYGRESNPATDSLTPYLLVDSGEDRGVCPDFLTEAVARFDEDENIPNMLTKAVAGLSLQLSQMTMNDNYKPYIQALKTFSQFPKLVTAIAQHPLFLMAQSAPGIEKHTLLGPFFRISPLQQEVTKEYFAAPKSMDKRHITTSQEALRLTLQTHQRDLLDIINQFVRAGHESRNRTLDWFAYIMNSNHKRRAMQVDPKSVSSDGFMMNVTVVLDGLCEPFMDATFSKISKIDIDYLRRAPRVDIKDETKLNADQSASDDYYKTKVDGTSNFISEVFFLALAAHHYGSEAMSATVKTIDREVKHLIKSIAELERERPKFANLPQQLRLFEARMKQWTDLLEKSMALKLTIEGVLGDKVMQTKSLLFMRYVTVWLLRVASETDYAPERTIKLPLPSEVPGTFRFLPEYVLEDIVSNFNFIITRVPDIMFSAVGNEIMTLSITFLTNSEYIKNPYLKAKLVSLLFHGTWPVYHRTKGVIGDSLTNEKFANDNLLHALMKFYIEVESTGAHTQFYDKFNIRYEIFQVIKCIWTNDVYKQRLTQESKTNTEFFLRFVNLLLNDCTYVLDEALTKFPKIHDLQAELKPENVLSAEERTTKEEELATAESQAQSYMQLTNETVSMMKLFTKTLSGSFTMPEIVDRVAAMVDYTLDTLVGPKSTNLRVDDPGKYQFHPKSLLGEFVDIFLNLGVSDNFVLAVARDGRSYKPVNFDTASKVLNRFGLRSAEEMEAWEKLKKKFKNAKELDDQNEEDLGDIPDEFLDPLLATLMKDPVILPTSRITVDRSTIRSVLLSDPHDPFNRAPLKIEEVVEDVEMKAKITAYMVDMRAKAKATREESMDITEG